jgi:hypothetical protein
MRQAPAAIFKIPTDSPQLAPRRAARPSGRPRKTFATGRSPALAGGTGRAATRGGGEVIELECGITVYPGPVRRRPVAGGLAGDRSVNL